MSLMTMATAATTPQMIENLNDALQGKYLQGVFDREGIFSYLFEDGTILRVMPDDAGFEWSIDHRSLGDNDWVRISLRLDHISIETHDGHPSMVFSCAGVSSVTQLKLQWRNFWTRVGKVGEYCLTFPDLRQL